MTFKERISSFSEKQVIILMLLVSVGIAIQCLLAGKGNHYTHYNNYVIFKNSFEHLIHNKNLYALHENEHFDYFKYSPAFALIMGLFYYLPDWLGVVIFNVINSLVLIVALRRLNLQKRSMKYVFLFILLELAISLSMTQTNALMAGLIILAFTYLEEDKVFAATFLITLTVFIKLFGFVAFALWLIYPNKIKFILYSIFWIAILTFIPLLVVSPVELNQQYQNWLVLLKNDHDASYGASFIGWMHSWFHLDLPKVGTVVVGAFVFLIPFIKTRMYNLYTFRLHILSSILLWIVIFNHKAENPTYIIALAGVAIWYFSQQPVTINKVLLWLALIFTSFSSTDLITPGWIAERYVEPYAVKAVFCCIIWFKLNFDLVTGNFTTAIDNEPKEN